MNCAATLMGPVEPGGVELVEPETQVEPGTAAGDPANDWLCAWCLNRVASEKDRFNYNGESEFSFKNPDGIRFTILTFRCAFGCKQVGEPTVQHSWFPGYAWCYCLCARCRMQLGWHYSGPDEFDGLIRDRIVRAMIIMS